MEKVIEKSKSWAYFNGASQGRPSMGGMGDLIFLSDSHSFKFSIGIGRSSNNKVKMMAFKLVMPLAISKGVQ